MMRRICQYLSIGIVTRYRRAEKTIAGERWARAGSVFTVQAGETQARRKGARKWRVALQGLEPGRG